MFCKSNGLILKLRRSLFRDSSAVIYKELPVILARSLEVSSSNSQRGEHAVLEIH